MIAVARADEEAVSDATILEEPDMSASKVTETEPVPDRYARAHVEKTQSCAVQPIVCCRLSRTLWSRACAAAHALLTAHSSSLQHCCFRRERHSSSCTTLHEQQRQ